jgi:hypothetical protein
MSLDDEARPIPLRSSPKVTRHRRSRRTFPRIEPDRIAERTRFRPGGSAMGPQQSMRKHDDPLASPKSSIISWISMVGAQGLEPWTR